MDSNSGLEVRQALVVRLVIDYTALKSKIRIKVVHYSVESKYHTPCHHLHKLSKGEIHVNLSFSEQLHIAGAWKDSRILSVI